MINKGSFRKVLRKVLLASVALLSVVGLGCSLAIKPQTANATPLDNTYGRLNERFEGSVGLVNPSLWDNYAYFDHDWYDRTTYRDEIMYYPINYFYVPYRAYVNGIDYSGKSPHAHVEYLDWMRFPITTSGGAGVISEVMKYIGVIPFGMGVVDFRPNGNSDRFDWFVAGMCGYPDGNIFTGGKLQEPVAGDWIFSDGTTNSTHCTYLYFTGASVNSGPYTIAWQVDAMHDFLGYMVASVAQSVYLNEEMGVAYQNGYNTGKANADTTLYNKGYQDGEASVGSAGAVMMSLFGSVVSVPVNVLNGLSSFMIWGIPVISIIISFLFIGLLLWVVKRFIS